jgi:hypothetical protein
MLKVITYIEQLEPRIGASPNSLLRLFRRRFIDTSRPGLGLRLQGGEIHLGVEGSGVKALRRKS